MIIKRTKCWKNFSNLSKKYKTIVGDQLPAINSIISEVQNGSISISTLRAIPPTIERICKNILIEKNILKKGDDKTALGNIIKEFEVLLNTTPVLQEDTVQLIKSFGRNPFLHGNLTPNDEIQSVYVTLMLNVLNRILQDYGSYTSLNALDLN